jgi:hypothetical protein
MELPETGLCPLDTDLPPAPQTSEEVLPMWKWVLNTSEWWMIEVLVQIYSNALSHKALRECTKYITASGTFGTYTGIPRWNSLVKICGNQVQVSTTLFVS